MSEPLSPVTEDDLHAYVDGQLSESRRAEVEAWLESNPEAAERVRAYREQNAALQAMFAPVLDEPLPARLTEMLQPKRSGWSMRVAAAVAWLAVGGIAGYLVHDGLAPAPTVALFAERAAVAHVVYAAEVRHPVEVTADKQDHLVKWLSNRLGKPLRTPDFGPLGYQLVGGRLLPGEAGPAAQFMYEDPQNTRLTLYVSTPAPGEQATAFAFREQGAVKVLYWVEHDLSFALVGDAERQALLDLAHVAYQAFGS